MRAGNTNEHTNSNKVLLLGTLGEAGRVAKLQDSNPGRNLRQVVVAWVTQNQEFHQYKRVWWYLHVASQLPWSISLLLQS